MTFSTGNSTLDLVLQLILSLSGLMVVPDVLLSLVSSLRMVLSLFKMISISLLIHSLGTATLILSSLINLSVLDTAKLVSMNSLTTRLKSPMISGNSFLDSTLKTNNSKEDPYTLLVNHMQDTTSQLSQLRSSLRITNSLNSLVQPSEMDLLTLTGNTLSTLPSPMKITSSERSNTIS